MVKHLDEKKDHAEDHIGILLWRAAAAWKDMFAAEMRHEGFSWHTEARGAVLAHLGPSGRSQAELVEAMSMTKQAVQQLLDQLEVDGVIRRVADKSDGRARRVELTELGLEDYAARARAKRRVEARIRKEMSEESFTALEAALRSFPGIRA
ncbi:MAG: MarR family transcriptional regulator [Hyphomicrobiaceae bacterium]|nr:MarR family transcriptional regulator [Hyphomicrobiaceae bacterium]